MQTQEHQWNSPELCSSAFRQDNSALLVSYEPKRAELS
jgi:hypothetical protein